MINLSSSDAKTLDTAACQAIRAAHDAAWNRIHARRVQRAQWEPRFVAHLCACMSNVAKAWQPTLRRAHPRLRLKTSVVFTHQSPYVKWLSSTSSARQRCELADLLIAFVDHTASPKQGIATLIQAKQSDNSTVSPSTSSEKKQFELLSTTPIFDIDAQAAPAAVDLTAAKMKHDLALLYGLTPPASLPPTPSSPSWSNDRWETAANLGVLWNAPPHRVSASQCLAETLVELVKGNHGWTFQLPPPRAGWRHFAAGASSSRDDWSMLINYLLEVTFKKPVRAMKAAGGTGGRGEEHTLYFWARTPMGGPMFFEQSMPETAAGAGAGVEAADEAPLRWIATAPDDAATVDPAEWQPAPAPPSVLLSEYPFGNEGGDGGGGGGGNPNDPEDAGPENGPISAVVFEITARDRDSGEPVQ